MSNLIRRLVTIGLAVAIVSLLFGNFFNRLAPGQTEIPYSAFLDMLEQQNVAEVEIHDNKIIVLDKSSGKKFVSNTPFDPDLIRSLRANKSIKISVVPSAESNFLLDILISWFPMLLLVGVWIYFMRQMQRGGRNMGFGNAKTQRLVQSKDKVTFKDVAGVDECKEELKEIVDFLKDPERFNRLGSRIPRGCLLIGAPGTGKTLLGKAIAGEAQVPFFSISGSDFVEMFVGVGASRVRDLFEQAKQKKPCIVFIDEIDAVGRHRGAGLGGGNDEREQTLNQLLVEMDGFEKTEGIIVIAATNRPDVLDPALQRPGRFDRRIVVNMPDVAGREAILHIHAREVPTAADVNLRIIARGTPGFSGADLANLVNEASLLAARFGQKLVTMHDFDMAKDKILLGAERKSMIMTDSEKRLAAYHEGGHALVATQLVASDQVHRATIIPRGQSLGSVLRLPEKDKLMVRIDQLQADIAVAMGGRVAEEIIFGPEKITTGAASDIQMATQLARRMVTEWGMSPKLGEMRHKGDDQDVFIGHSLVQSSTIADKTAADIDEEIKRIIHEGKTCAHDILQKKLDKLHALADALIKHETLTGEEVRELVAQGSLTRSADEDGASTTNSTNLPV